MTCDIGFVFGFETINEHEKLKFGSQMYGRINLAILLVFVWSWLELAKVSETFYQTHGLLVPNGNEMNVLQHESTQKLHPRQNKHS